MFIISHDHYVIHNQPLLSSVIMTCKIFRNRVIHRKYQIILMAFNRKFSQKFQKMRSRIFTECFEIHINTIHSYLCCPLYQILNDILSGWKLRQSFRGTDLCCKVINQSPYLKPLLMCLCHIISRRQISKISCCILNIEPCRRNHV